MCLKEGRDRVHSGYLKGPVLLQLLLEGLRLTSNRPLKFSQLWIAETRPFQTETHTHTHMTHHTSHSSRYCLANELTQTHCRFLYWCELFVFVNTGVHLSVCKSSLKVILAQSSEQTESWSEWFEHFYLCLFKSESPVSYHTLFLSTQTEC